MQTRQQLVAACSDSVLLDGDVVEPAHNLPALARFLGRDVGHLAIASSAVPVLLVGLELNVRR